MTMTPAELQKYAEQGAKAQLERILAIFPHLSPHAQRAPYKTQRAPYKRRAVAPSPKKKILHWSQTPAGKRKMSRVQRKAWQGRRDKLHAAAQQL